MLSQACWAQTGSGSVLAASVLRGKGMWNHALPLAGGGGGLEGREYGRQHRHLRSCYPPGGRGGRHQEEAWGAGHLTLHSQYHSGRGHLQHRNLSLGQEGIFTVKSEALWRTFERARKPGF